MILTGPGAAALLATLHARSFADGERWDEASMRALLEAGSFGCVGGLAPASDAPAGMALARVAADEAELLTLGVLPEARRQGVGRRLLDELAPEAVRRGAVRLLLEVSLGNVAARALYEAMGFVAVGRRRRYYPDGTDALVLAWNLELLSAA